MSFNQYPNRQLSIQDRISIILSQEQCSIAKTKNDQQNNNKKYDQPHHHNKQYDQRYHRNKQYHQQRSNTNSDQRKHRNKEYQYRHNVMTTSNIYSKLHGKPMQQHEYQSFKGKLSKIPWLVEYQSKDKWVGHFFKDADPNKIYQIQLPYSPFIDEE